MNNFIYALGVIVISVLEFTGFTFLLSYSFRHFMQHDPSFFPCLGFIIFALWLGKKVGNMSNRNEVASDGE